MRKYRPPQERTVRLHGSGKPGCKHGTSYPCRHSVWSWVQDSTYEQVRVTYLWTDTGHQTHLRSAKLDHEWQRTPLGNIPQSPWCAPRSYASDSFARLSKLSQITSEGKETADSLMSSGNNTELSIWNRAGPWMQYPTSGHFQVF